MQITLGKLYQFNDDYNEDRCDKHGKLYKPSISIPKGLIVEVLKAWPNGEYMSLYIVWAPTLNVYLVTHDSRLKEI